MPSTGPLFAGVVSLAVGVVVEPDPPLLFFFGFLVAFVAEGVGVEFCLFLSAAFLVSAGVGEVEPELIEALWDGSATNPSKAELAWSLGKSAAWAPNANVEETPARVPPITTTALVDDLRIFAPIWPFGSQ